MRVIVIHERASKIDEILSATCEELRKSGVNVHAFSVDNLRQSLRSLWVSFKGPRPDVVLSSRSTWKSFLMSAFLRMAHDTPLVRLTSVTEDGSNSAMLAGTRTSPLNGRSTDRSAFLQGELTAVSYLRPRVLAIKRLADVVVACVALALLALPMGIISTLVRLRIGQPVLFVQERPGLNGRPFRMFKFRTMSNARDDVGQLLPDAERLTTLGRILRSTSLDELPEFWNVLKGDMSLVGPRPLLVRYTPYFRGNERLRLKVRPGITGWAQVNGRNTTPWDERLAYDSWYVQHLSLHLDLRILIATVGRVLRSDGVIIDPESVMKNLDDERTGESP